MYFPNVAHGTNIVSLESQRCELSIALHLQNNGDEATALLP